MSEIIVKERQESRDQSAGDHAYAELRYFARYSADDAAIRAAVLEEAPSHYNGLPPRNIQIRPVFVDINNPDACIWDATVRYGADARPDTGSSVFSFDTGGGTEHVTQSLHTVATHAASGIAPSHGGAIGVTRDSVDGVDIIVPVYNWTEQHYLDDAYVTDSYKNTLFWLTGRVNQQSFRGKEPGEVIFLGASGSLRDEDDWEISFRFAASPNQWDLSVGTMTGIAKRGWEYLWVSYEDDEDQGSAIKTPAFVYVEQVYQYGDFSRLGIGTT